MKHRNCQTARIKVKNIFFLHTFRDVLLHVEDCIKSHGVEEDSDDVNRRDRLGSAGPLSKLPGSIQRDPTHEGNRVPDDNSSYVEEQVAKSDLKGSYAIRYQGSE